MEIARYRVCFNTEARPIGSGWRIVLVRTGRKWAHVRDQHGHGVRMPIGLWNDIAKKAVPLSLKKRHQRRPKASNKKLAQALNDSGAFKPFTCIGG